MLHLSFFNISSPHTIHVCDMFRSSTNEIKRMTDLYLLRSDLLHAYRIKAIVAPRTKKNTGRDAALRRPDRTDRSSAEFNWIVNHCTPTRRYHGLFELISSYTSLIEDACC